jgi:subtilisin family serine protease
MLILFPESFARGTVTLTLDLSEGYIELDDDLSDKEVEAFLHQYQLTSARPDILRPKSGRERTKGAPRRQWVSFPDHETIYSLRDKLLVDPKTRRVNPIYFRKDLLPRKTGLSFSDEILIAIPNGTTNTQLQDALKLAEPFKLVEEIRLKSTAILRIRLIHSTPANLLSIVDLLNRLAQILTAGPNWIQLNNPADSTVPDDTFFPEQWHLTRIQAPEGWDLSTGDPAKVIAILDTGCDLAHEDLVNKLTPSGTWRDVIVGDGNPEDPWGHGTCCASIAGADSDNNEIGVAGVAWNCKLLPVRMFYDEIVEGDAISAINWATSHGAKVISMSWHYDGLQSVVDLSLQDATDANIVLVAASGNDDSSSLNYPATNSSVIAVGASDQTDHRKQLSSSDGEQWGSNYGTDLSVMAPGLHCWAADPSGNAGNNFSGGGPVIVLGKNYPTSGSADGNYFSRMSGTSAATAHVAGLAALLLSRYQMLEPHEVRTIVERTADKVGGYAYASNPVSHPNGTWHQEMGYGRINVFRALDFADMHIKDAPDDTGAEPYNASPFWDSSDIVVRRNDDGVFSYEPAKRGQTNFVYVRVTNRGPNSARNVVVRLRAVAYAGTEFVYPTDWETIDADHVLPVPVLTSFSSIPAGGSAIAKFSLSLSQVDTLYGWGVIHHHPCLLAEVKSDNDYAEPAGSHSWESNNLAQKNITVVNALAGSTVRYKFAVGSDLPPKVAAFEIVIDRSGLPKDIALLLDPSEELSAFSAKDSAAAISQKLVLDNNGSSKGTVLNLDGASCADVSEVAALEAHSPGYRFSLQGARFLKLGERHVISVDSRFAKIAIDAPRRRRLPMLLILDIPESSRSEQTYELRISQRDTQGITLGGVTLQIVV